MNKIVSVVLIMLSCVVSDAFADIENRHTNSLLVNKTNGLISIEYNLCIYEHNSQIKKIRNLKCETQASFKLEPFQIYSFDLNALQPTDPSWRRYKRIYVSKISSANKYQYFISDYNDSIQYSKYINSSDRRGVEKTALYCNFFYETNTFIYETERGFICT